MATQDEIAALLRIGTRRLKELRTAGVIPEGDDAQVALEAYIMHLRGRAGGYKSEDGLDLTGERARLASEQADAQAMKNAELRGELARIGDLETGLVTVLSGVRERVLAISHKVALDCAAESDPAAVQAIIDGAARDALSELADPRVEVFVVRGRESRTGAGEADRVGEGGVAAAAPADGRRVGRRKTQARGGNDPGAGAVA